MVQFYKPNISSTTLPHDPLWVEESHVVCWYTPNGLSHSPDSCIYKRSFHRRYAVTIYVYSTHTTKQLVVHCAIVTRFCRIHTNLCMHSLQHIDIVAASTWRSFQNVHVIDHVYSMYNVNVCAKNQVRTDGVICAAYMYIFVNGKSLGIKHLCTLWL